MLKAGDEGARKGGEIVGSPGDVPRAIQEKPHPRPCEDVGLSCPAVGEHSFGQLESSLVELMHCPRCGYVGSESGCRH